MGVKKRNDVVKSNLKLVYYVYEKLMKDTFVTINKEDLISEGFIGLIKAASTYNGKVKFATYAIVCIRNQMIMFIRRNKKHNNVISLSTLINSNKDEDFELSEFITYRIDYENEVIAKMDLAKFLSECIVLDKKIIKLKLSGMTQKEIGKKVGYSRSFISRRLSKKYEEMIN